MDCSCNYSSYNNACGNSCTNISSSVAGAVFITQKKIWNQVRVPASLYLMNLSALTSAGSRLASGNNVNWNQMSDRVIASKQPSICPSRGNSLRGTITSGKPGASTPGGQGVDVKHDSYARYLNRKKASNVKTQTLVAPVPFKGNKTQALGLVANSIACCS